MDLLDKKSRQQLDSFLDPNIHELLSSDHAGSRFNKRWRALLSPSLV